MIVSTGVEVTAARVASPPPGRPDERAAAPVDRAALLAVAADPVRYAVLEALTAGTTCVCRLQEHVPVAANVLSYHLKVLREAGLISGAKRGRWIDYSLAADALDRLHGALPGAGARSGDRP